MVSRVYNFEEINLRTVVIGVRSNMGVLMSAGGHADCRSCKTYTHQENKPPQENVNNNMITKIKRTFHGMKKAYCTVGLTSKRRTQFERACNL